MDPYRKNVEPWSRVLKVHRKIPTLKDTILEAADEYFSYYNGIVDFKGWNTISTAIFRNSNINVKKQLDKLNLKDNADQVSHVVLLYIIVP